ncbi:MAG: 50S ribosomal protein L4 [Patescibacteria group bacterium]
MIKATVYNQEGQEVGEQELKTEHFGVPLNDVIIKQVVLALQANKRQPLAHVKTRSEVRGGGRKPWRQKGTGRARHGSIRSPLWRSGGKSFGPRNNRNFVKKVNRKIRQKALAMVLSDKVSNKKFIILDDLNISEAKTKQFIAVRDKLPTKESSLLVILPKNDINIIRAVSNVPKAKVVQAESLNILDILKHKYLLLPKSSLDVINKNFSKLTKPAVAKKVASKK